MTGLRRSDLVTVVVAVLAVLTLARDAQAQTPLQLATHDATTFWADEPCERHLTVEVGPLPPVDEAASDSGVATYPNCTAHVAARNYGTERAQVLDWANFCLVVTHEVGHLVLGPTYFAASDPSNPAHSPSEDDVMYYAPVRAYPSTCFPATFHLPDGTIVRWTSPNRGQWRGETSTLRRVPRNCRRGFEWLAHHGRVARACDSVLAHPRNEWQEIYGMQGVFIETPNEARNR